MNVQSSTNKLAPQQMGVRQQAWDDQREILRVSTARAAEVEDAKRKKDNLEFLANQEERLYDWEKEVKSRVDVQLAITNARVGQIFKETQEQMVNMKDEVEKNHIQEVRHNEERYTQLVDDQRKSDKWHMEAQLSISELNAKIVMTTNEVREDQEKDEAKK